MVSENKSRFQDEEKEIYSKYIRAGKRTYYFDVKANANGDYYIVITESKKKFNQDGTFQFEKQKIFLYKEDFNKFIENLKETIEYAETAILESNFNHNDALVSINLPQKYISPLAIDKILEATGDFMEELGFEYKMKTEPVFGSFFQELKFFLKRQKTKEEVNELYEKGKEALELKYIDEQSATITNNLSQSAVNLINSVKEIDEAVLRLGTILFVKVNVEGKSRIIIETISPKLMLKLNTNPSLLKDPNKIFELLSGEQKQINNNTSDEYIEV